MAELAPRFLIADAAAAYLGVDRATFLAEVRRGLWPAPMRRGKHDAWDRAALDARADALSGLARAGGGAVDDAAVKLAEDAWMKAINDAA